MKSRARPELLTMLVEGRFPIEAICDELAGYPWDADEPLVVLRREHIASILQRYLRRELTAAQVSAWADALEVRDDVGFSEEDSAEIEQTIFVLANPPLNGELTFETARTLLDALGAKDV